ncbi:hypothetical protein [Puia dinghuensis]|uniref:Uncharacterized protein n=1 Tax=Puia dinghuensis TaxID=1792502 RepID=A0A8J2UI03_9BACT|nr:hypothetical protein [Puia dinghuensis]GGB19743.1 hypothetical protein GCM10011511_49350 [Puia dinghuensis]
MFITPLPKKLLFLNCFLFILYLDGISQIPDNLRIVKDTTVNAVEIDPRQYVTVLYNRYRIREKLDTIWNWEDRKNVPSQKYNALDKDGQIKIIFDKSGFIRNTDFFGNVTLEAEISGSKGTRQIEVNPYSEIGVARKAIGIKSDPPYDVSNKLLNMIIELSEVDSIRRSLKTVYSFNSRSALNLFGEILRKAMDSCDKPGAKPVVIGKQVLDGYDDFYNTTIHLAGTDGRLEFAIRNATDIATLKDLISKLKGDTYDYYSRYIRDPFVQNYQYAANYINDKLPLILEFLSSFEKGGQEGLKAFLSLTSLTLIKYNDIKNNLIRDVDTLSTLHLPQQDGKVIISDSILLLYKDPLEKAVNALYYLSRLQGSEIEHIILDIGRDNIKNMQVSARPSAVDSLLRYGSSTQEQRIIADIINNYKDTLSILIARKAGEQIYKKLVKATIDLGKSGAAEGETLSLYLTWIMDETDSLQNSPRLEIGKYQLIQSGWSVDVSDIFSLVDRINPSSTIDPAHESPSVFKGAGGAVLMWTYSREDRGLNVHQNADGYFTRRKNVLMNFFQPSIGVNVSYVDFNTTKDVEIGTGLQLGLFHNKIFFGYGVNLTLLNPKDAPFYFYLGFSFAKLSDLFKDAGKISSSN